MRRREFITLVGGAAAAWPLAARAQQPDMPVIGFLNAASPDLFAHIVEAFRLGLNEMGYVEGRNVAIEYRWAENQYDRLPALAAELVRRRVSVITTGSASLAALAAKAATTTIPIVFLTGADPVTLGLVTSLNRPGSNLTGITTLNVEITPKRRSIEQAAHRLGIEPVAGAVHDRDGIERVISDFSKEPDGGIVAVPNPINNVQRDMLILLEQRYRLPTVHQSADGFLLAYFADMAESMRQAAGYVDRVLKGEKPSDLPVQAPTRYFLTVNLKTAKALGLVIPESFLLRADELIE